MIVLVFLKISETAVVFPDDLFLRLRGRDHNFRIIATRLRFICHRPSN
jgi:hypothetical protein